MQMAVLRSARKTGGAGRVRAGERGYEPEEYSAALRCLLLPADPQCRIRVFFGVGEGGLFRLREGEWQDLDPHHDPLTPLVGRLTVESSGGSGDASAITRSPSAAKRPRKSRVSASCVDGR